MLEPFSDIFSNFSGYSYALNTPFLCKDVDGLIPWPSIVSHVRISSRFGGRRHPITGQMQKQHGAIDLATNGEGHEVYAAARGEVVHIGWDRREEIDDDGNIHVKGYGRYVVLKHSDGYFTLYAHLQRDAVKVEAGQFVANGQVIALSGNTGGSTGPHLHFEVRKANNLTDSYRRATKIDPESIDNMDDDLDAFLEKYGTSILKYNATDNTPNNHGAPIITRNFSNESTFQDVFNMIFSVRLKNHQTSENKNEKKSANGGV